MTVRPVYPRGRKSVRKTPYFHALGIVVEWKKLNSKFEVVEVTPVSYTHLFSYYCRHGELPPKKDPPKPRDNTIEPPAKHISYTFDEPATICLLYTSQAEPIKQFGSYEVKAKLGYEVSGTINVLVTEKK